MMMKYNKLSCLESVKFSVQISVSLFGELETGVVPRLNIHMHAFHINTVQTHTEMCSCVVRHFALRVLIIKRLCFQMHPA